MTTPVWAEGVSKYANIRVQWEELVEALRGQLISEFPTAEAFDAAASVIDHWIVRGLSARDQALNEARRKLPHGAKGAEADAVRRNFANLKRRIHSIRRRLRSDVYTAPTEGSNSPPEAEVDADAGGPSAAEPPQPPETDSDPGSGSESEPEPEPEAAVPESAQLYETPPEYTRALVRYLNFGDYTSVHRIFDPAAGNGAILNVMRENGFEVAGRDLFTMTPPVDFLQGEPPPRDSYDMLVMNPPFQQTVPFLKRAIELGVPFAQLMLINTLATVGVTIELENMQESPDILILPQVRPFMHNGQKVNLPPCVWIVHHPEHACASYNFADKF